MPRALQMLWDGAENRELVNTGAGSGVSSEGRVAAPAQSEIHENRPRGGAEI